MQTRFNDSRLRNTERLLAELESDLDMPESGGRQLGDYCWLPGDTLPAHQEEGLLNPYNSGDNFSDIRDLFQRMESKIDAAFSDFDHKLQSIEARVTAIEQHPPASPESPSTSGSSSSEDRKRKRRTPPELQFQIRTVHSSLDDENKFHCHDRIDSKHNRKVVDNIIKEIGTGSFSDKQIREGCRTYRKTLHEREKEKTELDKKKMRIRYRQQRLYDRRQKAVNKKSKRMKKMWEDITAEMMTEEETGKENNYIRHRQSWRSITFNEFMDKLDEDKSSRSLAKPRDIGDSILRTPPPNAKRWMIMPSTNQAGGGDDDGLPPPGEISDEDDN